MIITITGYNGSGKSTLAKGLAKELKLRHYSAGDLLRKIAEERGLSLMELHRQMDCDRKIDLELDERSKRLGREEDNFVIDGRLAWHFIPKSIKVFVKIDLRKAAERVFRDCLKGKKERKGERENVSLEETLKGLKKRLEMNRERYKRLYGIDYLDEKNYDIVVDTSKASIPETRKRVLGEIRKFGKR